MICLYNRLLVLSFVKIRSDETSLCTLCEWNKDDFFQRTLNVVFASQPFSVAANLPREEKKGGDEGKRSLWLCLLCWMVSKSPNNLYFIRRFLGKTKTRRKVAIKRESQSKCPVCTGNECRSGDMKQNRADGFMNYQLKKKRIRRNRECLAKTLTAKNNSFERWSMQILLVCFY